MLIFLCHLVLPLIHFTMLNYQFYGPNQVGPNQAGPNQGGPNLIGNNLVGNKPNLAGNELSGPILAGNEVDRKNANLFIAKLTKIGKKKYNEFIINNK